MLAAPRYVTLSIRTRRGRVNEVSGRGGRTGGGAWRTTAWRYRAGATYSVLARRAIPCFGTTHTDHFDGMAPISRMLTAEVVTSAVVLETVAATARDTALRYAAGTGRAPEITGRTVGPPPR